MPIFICGAIHSLYQRASRGTQKGASITKVMRNYHHSMPIFICGAIYSLYQRASRGTQKGASITKVMRNYHHSMPIFICGAIHSLYQRDRRKFEHNDPAVFTYKYLVKLPDADWAWWTPDPNLIMPTNLITNDTTVYEVPAEEEAPAEEIN